MTSYPSVGIVSVGMGNISAIEGALRRLCIQSSRVHTPNDLLAITHLIIPGVGAMGAFMSRLKHNDLYHSLRSFAGDGKILGICLGFQSLYSYSHEGQCNCLDVLEGEVRPIKAFTKQSTNVGYLEISERNIVPPPVNQIIPSKPVLSENVSIIGYKTKLEYYFTHSFFVPIVKSTTHTAQLDHELCITAASSNGVNIYGTQFHPELSHSIGRALISQFVSQ
jgi:glutamine amidotransferase